MGASDLAAEVVHQPGDAEADEEDRLVGVDGGGQDGVDTLVPRVALGVGHVQRAAADDDAADGVEGAELGVGGVDDAQFHVHFAQARGAQGVVVLGVGDVRPDFAVAKGEEEQL